MKRSSLNKKVNKKLKELFEEEGARRCEARLDDKCFNYTHLSFAHRHKRNWYIGKEQALIDKNQVILACVSCHQQLEKDASLTESVFALLRGPEKEFESTAKTEAL